MRDERQYVVDAITAFLEGSGGRWDWKAFTSRPLRDTELDRIRQCAAVVELPLDTDGRATLIALIDQAELADSADPDKPRPWRTEAGALAGLGVGAILWWINHRSGAGLFENLHLLLIPAALGVFLVHFRNSRLKVGAFEPRVVEQNRRGRV